jgi:hypothetical protein
VPESAHPPDPVPPVVEIKPPPPPPSEVNPQGGNKPRRPIEANNPYGGGP